MIKTLVKSILAGLFIGIGGTVFLSLDNKILGASFFSIGLFGVLIYNLNLYTGKIGYLITNFNLKYIKELLITLLGNFIGACFIGHILKLTRIYDTIYPKAYSISQIKLNDNLISIIILSIFCGLLMYFAVNGFKKENDLSKQLVVYLGVTVFILSGFEHCVANMYYFSVADVWSLKTLGYTLIMILGNTIGSFIIPLADKITKEN